MQFSELSVGEKFTFNNEEYIKIQPEKISCCRSLVAQKTSNNEKVQIRPNEQVEKVQE